VTRLVGFAELADETSWKGQKTRSIEIEARE